MEKCVLEGLQKQASKDRQVVPEDIVDFLEKADVVFLDENNREVHFSRVVVAWEN